MSYHGGFSTVTASLRKFRLSLSGSQEELAQPLFEEGPLSNVLEMKSYGGLSTKKYPNNCVPIGFRLKHRRLLIERRRWIVDIMCGLAFVGIVLMMVETELFITKLTKKSDPITFVIKAFISASTVLLLIGICFYYYIYMQIKALDAGVKDWFSVTTNWTVFSLFMELFVCAIHPFPGDITVTYVSPTGSEAKVSIDAILSIMMMARLYLIAKFAVVHSHLVADTATNSIGALSKIKLNTSFVFKAVMTNSPSKLLIAAMLTTFLVNSWAMRTCEEYYQQPPRGDNSYLQVMWLISTTFLTIGYGDTIPMSYCGRYISICTGVMGVGTTALLVAVLARQLEQTRPERYVFNMVTRVQIEKRRKTAAANTIKSLFQLWMLRKYADNELDEKLRRRYEDQLKTSLRQLRAARQEMDHVGEFNVGIIEVSETVNRISDVVDDVVKKQDANDIRNLRFGVRLKNIENSLNDIREMLAAKFEVKD